MPKRSSIKSEATTPTNGAIREALSAIDGQADVDPAKLAARLLGSKGGSKGGPARAAKLSAKRRAEIAKKAAQARWKSR